MQSYHNLEEMKRIAAKHDLQLIEDTLNGTFLMLFEPIIQGTPVLISANGGEDWTPEIMDAESKRLWEGDICPYGVELATESRAMGMMLDMDTTKMVMVSLDLMYMHTGEKSL